MSDLSDKLKQYGGLLGRGLLLQMVPGMAEGFINKLFHDWKVDEDKLKEDVLHNKSLCENMQPDQKRQLSALQQRMGNLDFITSDLVIKSIKGDFPKVASLLHNWPEGKEWLAKQIEDIKKEVSSTE
jgi:hypothetical protein